MATTTRLLLPFTGGINDLALSYAVQMAEHRQATLVPCALIFCRPGKSARLEHIQQAQDFLELTRWKAQRQGVPIEPVRLCTHDVARSIEAMAGEMNCEAVLLFLCDTREVLLGSAEIRALVDHSTCNMHFVLLPAKRGRRAIDHPLHVPFPRISEEDSPCSRPEALLQEQTEENISLLQQIMQHDDMRR